MGGSDRARFSLRRRVIPGPERLEGRDLPSLAPLLYAAAAQRQRPAPIRAAEVAPAPAPLPTPHEQAREAFNAKFTGRFATGPGRFTDQSMQTYIYGGGTSSAFLHGNFELSAFSPVDPAGSVTGTATLFVKNVSNSGNALILDLTGAPSPDGRTPPALLSWTVNGASGGIFTNATGQGTVEIHYSPGGH